MVYILRQFIFILALLGLVTGCPGGDGGPPPSGTGTKPSVKTQKIAFTSAVHGNNEIYTINADGSGGQTRLTENDSDDYLAGWSPDGTRIVFESNRDGDFEIYVMNANGTGQTNLSKHTSLDRFPTWSPDGTRIAFESDRVGNFEIYVMNATDGSGPINLTKSPFSELPSLMIDQAPRWSPDSTRIAFESYRDGNFEIYVMNATNGSSQTNLTNSKLFLDQLPTWSPNGALMLFETNRDTSIETYVMNADGSGQVNLSNDTAAYDEEPAWSPDGTRIAFESNRDQQNFEIYVMNADGTGQAVRLTTAATADYDPKWSPDGTRIAFGSNRDGKNTIYVMNTDGSAQTRLADYFGEPVTGGTGMGIFAWSPK